MAIITSTKPGQWAHKRYFTGSPCRNGHIAERRISDGRCVECVKNCSGYGNKQKPETRRRYDTSLKGKAAKKRYRASAKRREVLNRYWQSPKGKACKHRANTSEKHKIAFKRFMATPKGKACGVRSASMRRARKKQQTTIPYSFAALMDRFAQFDNSCAYCGSREPLTQDHFIPLKRGGVHGIENIIPACRKCNIQKNQHMPHAWYSKQSFFSRKRWNKIKEIMQWTSP